MEQIDLENKEGFKFWYERCFCQSPSQCALKYDDEKMYEAWKVAYKLGVAFGIGVVEKENSNG